MGKYHHLHYGVQDASNFLKRVQYKGIKEHTVTSRKENHRGARGSPCGQVNL